MNFDLVIFADLRFPGGTSTALRNELRACALAGLRTAVMELRSPLLTKNRPPNPSVMSTIRETGAALLPVTEEVEARIALFYHPTLLARAPKVRPRVNAPIYGLVVHHPLFDSFGEIQYSLDKGRDIVRDLYGADLLLLPVGEAVRNSLSHGGFQNALFEEDWVNLIDPADFARPRSRRAAGPSIDAPLVVGRHSRPDLLKWPEPDAARQVYPESGRFVFRMLGVDRRVRKAFEPWPANWQAYPFFPGTETVAEFLRSLDVYSYFHHPNWREAFCYGVLEALAAGLPTVLPPQFAATFQDAAIYCAPEEAPSVYARLAQDAGLYARQSETAVGFANGRFHLRNYKARFDRLVGGTARKLASVRPSPAAKLPPRATVLALTSNGVGFGHLARQLAVADCMAEATRVVFLSLSEAAFLAARLGYEVEYRNSSTRLGIGSESWNKYFYLEMREALAYYRPDVVIFDGNVPYSGLIEAVGDDGNAFFVWMRRGMWRHADPTVTARAKHFDLVIEPGEICAAVDHGHSGRNDPHFVAVAPILHVPPWKRLTREAARDALGLSQTATIALLQLGSGRNFDGSTARQACLDLLAKDPTLHIVDALHPVSVIDVRPQGPRHHVRPLFPLGLYINAFDFAVAAAGYNTFHECLSAALPTLFVPNTTGMTDLQSSRGQYGAVAGWCLVADENDPYSIRRGLRKITDAETRRSLGRECGRIASRWDGAAEAARLIGSLGGLPIAGGTTGRREGAAVR